MMLNEGQLLVADRLSFEIIMNNYDTKLIQLIDALRIKPSIGN